MMTALPPPTPTFPLRRSPKLEMDKFKKEIIKVESLVPLKVESLVPLTEMSIKMGETVYLKLGTQEQDPITKIWTSTFFRFVERNENMTDKKSEGYGAFVDVTGKLTEEEKLINTRVGILVEQMHKVATKIWVKGLKDIILEGRKSEDTDTDILDFILDQLEEFK